MGDQYNTVIKRYIAPGGESIRIMRYSRMMYTDRAKFAPAALTAADERRADDVASSVVDAPDEMTYVWRVQAIARARRKVREVMRCNYSQHLKFLTLTFAASITSEAVVLSHIKRMCRRYLRLLHSPLRYIAIPEWHPSGHGLHVHMLVDAPYIACDVWREQLWCAGFVKINSIGVGDCKSDILRVIDYVLKYVGKDMDSTVKYKHYYFISKGWYRRIEVSRCIAHTDDEYAALIVSLQVSDVIDTRIFSVNVFKDIWVDIVDIYY